MKKILLLTLVILLLLSVIGCNEATKVEDTEETNITSEDVTTVSDSSETVTETEAETQEEIKLNITELNPDSIITKDGDYILSDMYTDILTDKSVADGWFYYYSEGTESGLPSLEWKKADGMYTSCEILFNMKNLKENMDVTYKDRFTGYVVYNLKSEELSDCENSNAFFEKLKETAQSNPDVEIFEMNTLQRNPGQSDSDGYETRSIVPVSLMKDETAQQDLIADVSEKFLRTWEDNESSEEMWAFFSYDDDTVYSVNLKTQLVES